MEWEGDPEPASHGRRGSALAVLILLAVAVAAVVARSGLGDGGLPGDAGGDQPSADPPLLERALPTAGGAGGGAPAPVRWVDVPLPGELANPSERGGVAIRRLGGELVLLRGRQVHALQEDGTWQGLPAIPGGADSTYQLVSGAEALLVAELRFDRPERPAIPTARLWRLDSGGWRALPDLPEGVVGGIGEADGVVVLGIRDIDGPYVYEPAVRVHRLLPDAASWDALPQLASSGRLQLVPVDDAVVAVGAERVAGPVVVRRLAAGADAWEPGADPPLDVVGPLAVRRSGAADAALAGPARGPDGLVLLRYELAQDRWTQQLLGGIDRRALRLGGPEPPAWDGDQLLVVSGAGEHGRGVLSVDLLTGAAEAVEPPAGFGAAVAVAVSGTTYLLEQATGRCTRDDGLWARCAPRLLASTVR